MDKIGYYLEKTQGKFGFNLWTKEGKKYYNVATLFYQDPLCGTQWAVSAIEKSVSYTPAEIKDELLSPLKGIAKEKAEQLLKLASAENVARSIEDLLIE